MLPYHSLEALVSVVTSGSFQRAARALHITQSAVSQRISLLEVQLGERLLVRTSPPVPTKRGLQMITHARHVMEMEEQLVKEPDAKSVHNQIIRLGINADSLETWFFPATKEIVKKNNYLLELVVENEEYTFNRMRAGEFFACISSQKKSLPGCEVELIGRIEYRFYCTPQFRKHYLLNNRLSQELVKTVPALLYDDKDLIHERLLKKLGIHTPLFPHHQVPSSRGFYDTILSGMAYGTLAFPQAKKDIKRGRLINLHPEISVDVPWYWHYQRRESARERYFREEVSRKASELLKVVL